MTLTIQAGKYYRTRDGRKVGPIVSNPSFEEELGYNEEVYPFAFGEHSFTLFGRSGFDTSIDRAYDLIAEWTDEVTNPPHIITSANGRTYDLTDLTEAFGLLPSDVQSALRKWDHGCRFWNGGHWMKAEANTFTSAFTFRACPAPKVTEHVLWWDAGNNATIWKEWSNTHRITIRFIGDGFGTYTGPDGATITVEKAQ